MMVMVSLSLLSLAPFTAASQIDPKIYSKIFVNNQPIFDAMSEAVLQHLPVEGGSFVLDLASGPGEPSVTLAKMDRVNGTSPKIARIVCTDYQEAMNQKAKERAEAAGPFYELEMVYATTSGDNLDKWNAQEFDAVMMNFGLMFIPDRQKALHEIYRVLKPGGFAYISVWKSLTFYSFAREVMKEVAGEDLGEFAINPMALKDDQVVKNLAMNTKLQIVKIARLDYPFKLGSPGDTADALTIIAGQQLKDVEAKNKDARTKFYEIVEREVMKRGWLDNSSEVSIPSNIPEMLILQKPFRDEL